MNGGRNELMAVGPISVSILPASLKGGSMPGKDGWRMGGSGRFLGVLAVAVTATLVACSEGGRGPSEVGARPGSVAVQEQSKENPYAFVGEEHNAQVDHVLREFAKRWRKNMKRQEICAAIEKINDDYVAKKGRSEYKVRFRAASHPCRNEQASLRAEMGGAALRFADMSYDENFSAAAVELVTQIEGVMASASSAADVANRLVPINNAALGSLGGTDAALVLSVSSIAQSSIAYWEGNLDTWVTVYSQGGDPAGPAFLRSHEPGVSKFPGTPAYGIDWGGVSRVSGADLSGGIVGGIRGIFGGPGGVAAGAGTGAAYASIGAAIGEIIRLMM